MDITFPIHTVPPENIEEQLCTNNESRKAGGLFAIGTNRFWHGGIHLTVPGEPIRALADGEVIAYRMNNKLLDYEVDPPKSKDGKDTPRESYSSSFVLLRHRLFTPKGTEIPFYSLYMHLKPMTKEETEMESDADKPAFIFKKTHYIVDSDRWGGGMPILDEGVIESKGIIPFGSHFVVHPNDDHCNNQRFRHIRVITKKITGCLLVTANGKNTEDEDPRFTKVLTKLHSSGRILEGPDLKLLDDKGKESTHVLPHKAFFTIEAAPPALSSKRYEAVVWFPGTKKRTFLAKPAAVSKSVAGLYRQMTGDQPLHDETNGGIVGDIAQNTYFTIVAGYAAPKGPWTRKKEDAAKGFQLIEYETGSLEGYALIDTVQKAAVLTSPADSDIEVVDDANKRIGNIAGKQTYIVLRKRPPAGSPLLNMRYRKIVYPDPKAPDSLTCYAFLRTDYDVTHLEKTASDNGKLWFWGHEDLTARWGNELFKDDGETLKEGGAPRKLGICEVFEMLDEATVPASHWSRSTGWRKVTWEYPARQQQPAGKIEGYSWVGVHVETVPAGAAVTADKDQTFRLVNEDEFNSRKVIQPPTNASLQVNPRNPGYTRNLLDFEKRIGQESRPWDGDHNGINVRESADKDSRVLTILNLGTVIKLAKDVAFTSSKSGERYVYTVSKAGYQELSDGGFVLVDGKQVTKRSEIPKPIEFHNDANIKVVDPPVPIRRGDIVGYAGRYRQYSDMIHMEVFTAGDSKGGRPAFTTNPQQDCWGPFFVRVNPGVKLFVRQKKSQTAEKYPANTSFKVEERDYSAQRIHAEPVYCRATVVSAEGWIPVKDLEKSAAPASTAKLKDDVFKLYLHTRKAEMTVTETVKDKDGKDKKVLKKIMADVVDEAKDSVPIPGKKDQTVSIVADGEYACKVKYSINEGKTGWIAQDELAGKSKEKLDSALRTYRYDATAEISLVPENPAKAFEFKEPAAEEKKTLQEQFKTVSKAVTDESGKEWMQIEGARTNEMSDLDGKSWLEVTPDRAKPAWVSSSDAHRVYERYDWLPWKYVREEDPGSKDGDKARFSEDGFCDVSYLETMFDNPDEEAGKTVLRGLRRTACCHPSEWDMGSDKKLKKWERLKSAPWNLKDPEYGQVMNHIANLQWWHSVPGLPDPAKAWHFHPPGFIAYLRSRVELSEQQLAEICETTPAAKIHEYIVHFNNTLQKYEINTPLRQAHFLAQLGAETGFFRYSEELASGTDYDFRRDLGNVFPGDGPMFKGRGLLQLTGRANYKKFELYNGQDFTSSAANAQKLAGPELASDAGGWTWKILKGCNEVADNPSSNADHVVVREITKRINGGVNHMGRRLQFFRRARWHLCRDIDKPK